MNYIKQELDRLRRILAEQVYTDERTVMLLTDEIKSIQEAMSYDDLRRIEDRIED